jgi:hypothetical protein
MKNRSPDGSVTQGRIDIRFVRSAAGEFIVEAHGLARPVISMQC